MTMQEVHAKFRGCAEYAGRPKSIAEAIIETVGNLERAPDIKELAKLLAR